MYKDFLILRLGIDGTDDHPNIKLFDITGHPMKGWVMVEKAGFKSNEDLFHWLEKTREFALTLRQDSNTEST